MAQRALFLRWALFASLVAVGLTTALLSGVFTLLAEHDPTHISFLILAIMVGATAWCGRLTWRLEIEKESGWTDRLSELRNEASHGHFAANICTLLGLLGTVVGMIIMFYAAAKGLGTAMHANDAGVFKTFMNTVLSGLWPAFLANATGLTGAAVILVQFHMLEHAIKKAELDGEPDGKVRKP